MTDQETSLQKSIDRLRLLKQKRSPEIRKKIAEGQKRYWNRAKEALESLEKQENEI